MNRDIYDVISKCHDLDFIYLDEFVKLYELNGLKRALSLRRTFLFLISRLDLKFSYHDLAMISSFAVNIETEQVKDEFGAPTHNNPNGALLGLSGISNNRARISGKVDHNSLYEIPHPKQTMRKPVRSLHDGHFGFSYPVQTQKFHTAT